MALKSPKDNNNESPTEVRKRQSFITDEEQSSPMKRKSTLKFEAEVPPPSEPIKETTEVEDHKKKETQSEPTLKGKVFKRSKSLLSMKNSQINKNKSPKPVEKVETTIRTPEPIKNRNEIKSQYSKTPEILKIEITEPSQNLSPSLNVNSIVSPRRSGPPKKLPPVPPRTPPVGEKLDFSNQNDHECVSDLARAVLSPRQPVLQRRRCNTGPSVLQKPKLTVRKTQTSISDDLFSDLHLPEENELLEEKQEKQEKKEIKNLVFDDSDSESDDESSESESDDDEDNESNENVKIVVPKLQLNVPLRDGVNSPGLRAKKSGLAKSHREYNANSSNLSYHRAISPRNRKNIQRIPIEDLENQENSNLSPKKEKKQTNDDENEIRKSRSPRKQKKLHKSKSHVEGNQIDKKPQRNLRRANTVVQKKEFRLSRSFSPPKERKIGSSKLKIETNADYCETDLLNVSVPVGKSSQRSSEDYKSNGKNSNEKILRNLEAAQLPVRNSINIPPEITQQIPPEGLDKSLFPLWKTFEELLCTETTYVRQLGSLILVSI